MSRAGKRNGLFQSFTALSIFILFAVGGTGRPSASAQVKAGASIQHEVTVTLKLIQVFVTDAHGKPALNLDRFDFVLYDNGSLQTITDFERHVLAAPAVDRAEAVPPLSSAKPAAAPLLGRKFIFLIDYIRNGFEGVQKARTAALEFLNSKVRPDDEAALFSLSSMSGLTLHEYFTSDHRKVRAAFKKLRDVPGLSGVDSGRELIGMELMTAQIFGPHGGHLGPSQRNLFAEIAEWAKALRSIPGQKNIILFTQGFGKDVVHPSHPNNALFEMMTRSLASANAPVFTVDTTPQAPPGLAVDAKLPSGTLSEDSLAHLSKMTGGRYLGSVNYHSEIATAIENATANYYVLGYGIPVAWDGKYHDVKVEIRRPGYLVHAQRGYFNPVPFARLSPLEKHLQLIEAVLAEGAQAKRNRDIPLTTVQFAGAPETNMIILSEIPSDIRESVGDHVELISLVLNENKAIVDGKRAEIDWNDFRAGTIYQYGLTALAPGRYDCRAVVRNLDDGRVAVGACTVDVPAPSAGGPAMFPPLLLVPGADAQYLNLTLPGPAVSPENFYMSTIFPFPAKEYVPLVGALEQGTPYLFATLRCVWEGERRGEGEIEMSARLTPEGTEKGEPIDMNLLDSFSRGKVDFYFIEFDLPGLLPGRYQIEIRAEDMFKGSAVRTAVGFTVRPPA